MRMSRISLAVLAIFVVSMARADNDEAKAAMKKLAGTWVAVSVEKDGSELPTKGVDSPQLDLKPDGKYQYQQGDQKQQGTWKVDPSTKPGQFDMTPDDSKQKPTQGIYQVKNSQLQICVSSPGKERPRQFSTKQGNGQQFFTYKKKKDSDSKPEK